jgi:ribosomal protein S25
MGMFIHRRKVNKGAANKKAAPKNTPKAETKDEKSVVNEPKAQETKYSKSEINRASVEDLRKIADEIGIKGSRGMTGGELKKLLIEQLGL